MHDLDTQGLCSNPIQFYDFLQNRVLITFRPKFDPVDPEHPEFDLTLSKKMNYDVVSFAFGQFRHPFDIRLDVS